MNDTNTTPVSSQKAFANDALFDDSRVELDINNVKPGMHLTVLAWRHVRDFSWIGEIFHVVSVNAPFIVVNRRGRYETRRQTLDYRQVTIRELTEDFVEAAQVSPSTLPSNAGSVAFGRNGGSPADKPL